MKRLFVTFLLLLLILVPAASATERKYEYQSSDWARKDVEKAIAIGFDFDSHGGDYRLPITRGCFAENAASLVVLEFGSNLDSYLRIMNYREQLRGSEQENSNYYQGTSHRAPKNPSISEDGTKLIYTATVKKDVYYADENGKLGSAPVQLKGVYTVTMDLKTGKQTYTRADLK